MPCHWSEIIAVAGVTDNALRKLLGKKGLKPIVRGLWPDEALEVAAKTGATGRTFDIPSDYLSVSEAADRLKLPYGVVSGRLKTRETSGEIEVIRTNNKRYIPLDSLPLLAESRDLWHDSFAEELSKPRGVLPASVVRRIEDACAQFEEARDSGDRVRRREAERFLLDTLTGAGIPPEFVFQSRRTGHSYCHQYGEIYRFADRFAPRAPTTDAILT